MHLMFNLIFTTESLAAVTYRVYLRHNCI